MRVQGPSLVLESRQDLPRAIIAMAGASALVAATTLIAKILGLGGDGMTGLHPLQVSAGRFCFALSTLGVLLALRPSLRPPLAGTRWRWHLLRSLCGWMGVTCMFAAAARMPLAEATAISFLSPLVTMILALIMLGESAGAKKWLAALVSVAGAAILLQPGSEAFRPASLLALAAAGLLGLEAIFIKRLSGSEPPLRILLINNSIGAVVSLSVAAAFWTWPTTTQWLLLATLGSIMVTAQALFIQSMKRGQASSVIPAFYTALIFAAVYDFLFFATRPAGSAMAGAALIVTGAILLALAGPKRSSRAKFTR